MNEELKPCPFCGGSEIECKHDGDGNFWHHCKSCDATGPFLNKRSDEEELSWNTRPAHPKVETVEEWEKRTGRKYPDDGPVWLRVRIGVFGEGKIIDVRSFPTVCACDKSWMWVASPDHAKPEE